MTTVDNKAGITHLDLNDWINLVWKSIGTIPIGEIADELEAAWRNHLKKKNPVAVIFGAYDSGKSSLLKRLLFEDGAPVPSWITVSGRRETFWIDEATGATWTFRDSPGLAGGNDEHDMKALESLDLADLFVWVLPPQLVTDNKETFDAIVTGSWFGVGGEYVARSLVAVLARIDEAGTDPFDNADGYFDLCKRKQAEFSALLTAVGAPIPRWGVHPVSADPYQGVGNEQPDASIYAKGSGWDGVPELRKALAEASQHAEELRLLSGYRFASRAIASLAKLVQDERSTREEARATCENELERVGLWRKSLDSLRRKGAADLHRAIEDELLSASRTGTAAAVEALHKRLAETVDRWNDQAYADFEQLAASADQEAGERASSPSMERLKRLIFAMSEGEAEPKKPNDEGKVLKYSSGFGGAFRKGFKAYASADIGMSTEEAAKHIREWNESGVAWSAFREAKKGKTFANENVIKKASSYVKWAEVLDTCGPILEQLGPLLYEISGDVLSVAEANKKAQRRQKLRNELRNAADEIEKEVMTGFEKMVASFGEWLDQQENVHQSAKRAMDAQLSEITRYEAELESLLSQRPV